MNEKTVKVTVELPKNVVEWFKESETESIKKILEYRLIELCHSEVDGITPDVIISKFALEPIFKEYGLME